MSASLPDHLGLIATAPSGIQKLRGLILELAVRGKLVPQDPNDEPASELLKRIAKEWVRLEAKGTYKKSKATPVSVKEQPYDAPDGWVWVRLTHFGEFRGGKTPSTNRSDYWDGSVPWVSPKDMKSLVISKTEDHVSDLAISDGLSVIPASSVLIVVRSGILRRTIPVGINSLQCTVNQDLKALCLVQPDMAQYVQLMIRGFERLILETLTKVGTTVESIKFEEFSQQPFPLPPLAEQHRIVAKVDELMALCDRLEAEQTDATSAHAKLVETLLGTLTQSRDAAELAANWQRLSQYFDTLFSTETSLDALKQTILQLAVMGKLVPQDPNDEPASELLKRIAKERGRLEAEGVCKKSKAMPPVAISDQPFALAETWRWVPIGEILGVTSSKRIFESDYVQRGIPFYRSKEIGELSRQGTTTGSFYISESKHAELKSSRDFPRAGDLLLTSVGSIGNTWIADDRSFYFKDGNITQIIHSDLIFMEYMQRFIQGPIFMSMATDTVSGTAYNALTIIKIKQMLMPLPPLSEQHRIVAKVDELMALCDRLAADLAEFRTQQARLSTTLIDAALQAA